jgi:EAL domain-containing protein (putative c-di-GMP-specific phosphodiesterase class I)
VLVPGGLRTVFQPIVRFGESGWAIHALECLSRGPEGTPFEDAAAMFAASRDAKLHSALDYACVDVALETVARECITHDLFINVNATTLVSGSSFPTFLAATAARNRLDWCRVTVEITEHARGADVGALVKAGRELRALGARVAFDDFGTSECDRRALRACSPDVVKIEGTLFSAARTSYSAMGLLESVVDRARASGATIVAEGLERPADLFVAARLGIELLQGFLLCPPLHADDVFRAEERLGGSFV